MVELSEASAVIRARAYIKRCGVVAAPVDIDQCAAASKAEIRYCTDLTPGESGNTLEIRGHHIISVNARERPERIRFTVFHELAHIELGLPSIHGDSPMNKSLYNYSGRPREEVLCDVFAAECLIPYAFLKEDLNRAEPGIGFLSQIASRYQASLTCAASRVTEGAPFASAYVLSQDGFIRFVTCSAAMRTAGFRLPLGIAVPAKSISATCICSTKDRSIGLGPAYLWTSADQFADIDFHEEITVLRAWNQAITLLWPDDLGDASIHRASHPNDDEDKPLLRELDGILPWPTGKRRR